MGVLNIRQLKSVLWLGVLATVLLGIVATPPHTANAQEPSPLTFFVPVSGNLNDARPAETWQFEGYTGQVVSLIAVTTDGDLDPVLQVTGPDGQIVAENDDLDSLVRDAGLEALMLPADGTYTVRVSRYQGEQGASHGSYQLTLTPGFARQAVRGEFEQGDVSWVTPDGQPVPLLQGYLQMRVSGQSATLLAVPPEELRAADVYLQAEARLLGTPPYAEFGLILRAQGPGLGRFYQFKVNTQGQWHVLYQDETGVYTLRTWTDAPVLNTPNRTWSLAVMARGERLDFFANGVMLGTVSDARLLTPGTVGVFVSTGDQPSAATVLFDQVIATTRLGSTYRGLPLALTTWEAPDPATIVNELAEGGHITPVPARDLYLFEKTQASTDLTSVFELLGSEQAVYSDFLFGGRVTIVTEGQSVGCGLVFRWADERNLSLAYVDSSGGFGLVQARDAQLTTNVYDLSPLVQPQTSRLLIIAQGERVAYYLNGALVAQETVFPGSGRVGVALLNYEDVNTRCLWSELWVWPLTG
jgi:hypothetical protein